MLGRRADHFISLEKKAHTPPEEMKSEQNNCCFTSTYIGLCLLCVTFGVGIDLLSFYTGLKDLTQELLGFIPPRALPIPILFYALQSSMQTKLFSFDGIKDILHALQHESLREKFFSKETWKPSLISLVINSFALFFDAIAYYYFLQLQNFGLNTAIKFLIALLASFSNIPTETLETDRLIRSFFLRPRTLPSEENEHDTTFKKLAHLSKTFIVVMLKTFGAFQDFVQVYTAVAATAELTLGITSSEFRMFVLFLSLTNAINDLTFNGANSKTALDMLTNALSHRNYQWKEATLFSFSVFSAAMVGHATMSLMKSMIVEPDATLPKPLPPHLPYEIATVLAIGAGTREFVNYTRFFYEFFKYVTDYLSSWVQWLQEKKEVSERLEWSQGEVIPQEEVFEEYEPTPLSPTHSPPPPQKNPWNWARFFSRNTVSTSSPSTDLFSHPNLSSRR